MALDTVFLKLHADFPLSGVGADWCSREAVLRLPPLRKPPSIIDLGCGAGRQTILLAKHFRSPIQAVEIDHEKLSQLMEAAAAVEVSQWIRPRNERFTHLPDVPDSYDLIWSEGPGWRLGLRQALTIWGPLLRPRGVMVVSEITWLGARRPEESAAFWARVNPTMTDIDGNLEIAEQAGFHVFDFFVLPRSTWWEDYYGPLSRRVLDLRQRKDVLPAEANLLDEAQAEIDMFKRFGSCFGCVFFMLRPV